MDALGSIIAVVVAAASVSATVIGVRLLDKVVEHPATVTRVRADAGFSHDLGSTVPLLGVEVVKRSGTGPGSYRTRSGGSSSRSTARQLCPLPTIH